MTGLRILREIFGTESLDEARARLKEMPEEERIEALKFLIAANQRNTAEMAQHVAALERDVIARRHRPGDA